MANVSWAFLTFNRASTVQRALPHCVANAGFPFKEFVWVDNGSEGAERAVIASTIDENIDRNKVTTVLNPRNLGVDKGYNRAIAICSSPWIVITGCDRLLNKNWLKDMMEIVTVDQSVKCVSIYSHPIDKLRERVRGPKTTIGGINVQPAMPFGARLFHRDLLKTAGYFREDFGLYGWSDVEYAERIMRVCNENKWKYLVLLDSVANHLGDEGSNAHKGMDPKSYWEFKKAEVKDPAKQEKLKWCAANNYPFFNPFA